MIFTNSFLLPVQCGLDNPRAHESELVHMWVGGNGWRATIVSRWPQPSPRHWTTRLPSLVLIAPGIQASKGTHCPNSCRGGPACGRSSVALAHAVRCGAGSAVTDQSCGPRCLACIQPAGAPWHRGGGVSSCVTPPSTHIAIDESFHRPPSLVYG